MTIRKAVFLVGAAMAAFFQLQPAEADDMTFSLVRSDFRAMGLDLYQIIYATGDITPGTADRLSAQLKSWGIIQGGWVYFDSPGGSPVEAMKVGEVIRAARLQTSIGARPVSEKAQTAPGVCASACGLAYLGGDFRYIDKDLVYAVHRFFAAPGAQIDSDAAQLLSGLEVSYIARMGADPELFRLMTLKGGNDVTIVPHDLLRRYHVVTDAIKSTVWSIQNADGAIYLRVVQEENRGTNKMLFYCDRKQGLIAMGFMGTVYGPQVVSETKYRGWMFDGEFIDVDPRLSTVGPSVKNNYVEMQTQVPPILVSRILSSKRVGLATQGANRGLFAGFEIKMDDEGREAVAGFMKTCRR